jgi:hypothetical protein
MPMQTFPFVAIMVSNWFSCYMKQQNSWHPDFKFINLAYVGSFYIPIFMCGFGFLIFYSNPTQLYQLANIIIKMVYCRSESKFKIIFTILNL